MRIAGRAMAMVLGLLAGLFGGGARADIASGIRAYDRGDYPAALRAFEAGAVKGDPQALYNLGVAYAEGRAVPRDEGRALSYYRQGAERGSVLAAFNLAQAYRKGQGVAPDLAKAVRWYRFAAERGHYKAGNELGILYTEGRGVPHDPVEGFAWIYPATHASIMDEAAMTNAMQAASRLDRQQIAEAQARGQAYFKRYTAPHRRVVETLRRGGR
ncbi:MULTISPECIES: tetratricopeptide repeat protein [Methylobacterium]|uniref:Sel1 repeat family protein n=1 Tax=Methylobacterium jeotgali TaxID=381630 RepID=A0ABQ4SWK1_9HYPH|nr:MULTISPECIES: tetratricopeptide repeat protein [Methylobacterium]PIU05032.1 MAG: hypothetical protein COT56_17350 [Methylobacterium sp. CG09_land_8_20_14_0_10_71_15]PIU11534.1 MAG: hypothetical protein COT28_19845 [Methylobacterium sp. CG08_land_8_20_14_0_20_71_15]GBU16605.1 hypothetical protein AwMethylo_08200 [Methylobacterium sp.]GJE07590.1 hypothetical protein AOPFMNJM_2919 [Methylobacterium jeotgali]